VTRLLSSRHAKRRRGARAAHEHIMTDAALLERLNAAEYAACPAVALRLTSSTEWMHHIVQRRLRIGMCEDDKLGKLLDPALINILNFLGSQSATVKTKAMGILSHLNKRAPEVARVPTFTPLLSPHSQ
jgi:hypothetical protein